MSDQNKMQIDCPGCGQRFSADMPKAQLVNTPSFSAVIAPHERVVRCHNSKCNTPMTFALVGAQMQWQSVAITEQAAEELTGSRIIPAMSLVS